MRTFRFFSTVFFSGSMLLFSCKSNSPADTESEVKQTGSDLLEVKQEARAGYFEEFQRFKQHQTNKLNEVENRIEAYKKSIAKEPVSKESPSKDQAEANTAQNKSVAVAEAEHQVTLLRKRLEEFSEEGNDKLSKFELDFSKDLSDLDDAVNKFAPISKS
jgi:hypothetical protein